MKINLFRTVEKTDKYTIGRLYIEEPNYQFACYIVEDTERVTKVKGKTAIPRGEYQITITHSQRFDRELPILLNVPNFTGVRIHAGNDNEDTEGCLLPNFAYRGKGNGALSKMAETALLQIIKDAIDKGEKVFIEIS